MVEGGPECNFKRSAIGPRESQCPSWRLPRGVIQFFGTGSLLLEIFWFSSRVHLKTFHSDIYIHRLEINTRWCLLMQKPKNWTQWSSVGKSSSQQGAGQYVPYRNIQERRWQIQWTPFAGLIFHLSQYWSKLCQLIPSLNLRFQLPRRTDGGPGIGCVSAV